MLKPNDIRGRSFEGAEVGEVLITLLAMPVSRIPSIGVISATDGENYRHLTINRDKCILRDDGTMILVVNEMNGSIIWSEDAEAASTIEGPQHKIKKLIVG